jgi:hypothetical protein
MNFDNISSLIIPSVCALSFGIVATKIGKRIAATISNSMGAPTRNISSFPSNVARVYHDYKRFVCTCKFPCLLIGSMSGWLFGEFIQTHFQIPTEYLLRQLISPATILLFLVFCPIEYYFAIKNQRKLKNTKTVRPLIVRMLSYDNITQIFKSRVTVTIAGVIFGLCLVKSYSSSK